jgi:hypothetical protein
MDLNNPFDPKLAVANVPQLHYNYSRALIESVSGGGDVFQSEGDITKQIIPQQIPGPGPFPIQMNQTVVQDNRVFEGWRHVL